MDIKEFEDKFLLEIKNNDKECIKTIESNEKIIQLNFNEKPENLKTFVEKINDIIINENINDFSVIEDALKHPLFEKIYNEFKESKILIRACQEENKKVLQWLLTMNIKRYIQDKNGMTALMHAAEHEELLFVIDALVENDDDNVHLTDIDGKNALFHAINNLNAFVKLLRTKIDINHQDKEGNTIFISCCKNEIFDPYHKIVKIFATHHETDITIKNNEGKSGLEYLIRNGKYRSINFINNSLNNINKNDNENIKRKIINETSLYDLIPILDNIYDNIDDINELTKRLMDYCKTLVSLIKLGFNLNKEIDNVGNTLMMYFMMKKDYVSIYYLLKYDDLDLSIQNQLGINSVFLTMFLSTKNIPLFVSLDYKMTFFVEDIKRHKSYDCSYIDPKGNNLLIHYIVRDDLDNFLNTLSILLKKDNNIDIQNNKNETALIIATKLGRHKFLTNLFLGKCNINHQDHLGNTALFYAIKIKDKYTINLLAYNHADPTIKNNQGVSPMDLANEIKDEEIFEILKKPVTRHEMEKRLKKSDSNKGIFSSLLKKKDTDKKLEEYIQNYQIKNYQNEYDELLVNDYNTYKSLTPEKISTLPTKLYQIYREYYKNNYDQ